MGQTNRVRSVRIAAQRSGEKARGAVLGSDAFFPFPDGVEEAARAGVTAIAQPGGSVRDDEVIAAADRSDLAIGVHRRSAISGTSRLSARTLASQVMKCIPG